MTRGCLWLIHENKAQEARYKICTRQQCFPYYQRHARRATSLVYGYSENNANSTPLRQSRLSHSISGLQFSVLKMKTFIHCDLWSMNRPWNQQSGSWPTFWGSETKKSASQVKVSGASGNLAYTLFCTVYVYHMHIITYTTLYILCVVYVYGIQM